MRGCGIYVGMCVCVCPLISSVIHSSGNDLGASADGWKTHRHTFPPSGLLTENHAPGPSSSYFNSRVHQNKMKEKMKKKKENSHKRKRWTMWKKKKKMKSRPFPTWKKWSWFRLRKGIILTTRRHFTVLYTRIGCERFYSLRSNLKKKMPKSVSAAGLVFMNSHA